LEKEKKFRIGFDLGGTKMMAVLFDKDYSIVARVKKKTRAYEGSDIVIDRILRVIQALLKEAGISATDVVGLGIGCPGPLDLEKGVIIEAPNLAFKNVEIKKIIEKKFGFGAAVINDVDAGVHGEYYFGAAKGTRCAVGVFPGTGIGAGAVYNGQLITGKKNSCMELGHLRVVPNGPLCGCGNHGCLEAVASRMAISANVAIAAQRGLAPHLDTTIGTDVKNIRSKALCQSIDSGDTVIETIVRDAASWLGLGVSYVINLLAPEVVVLGGGLVEAMPKIYVSEVKRSAKERVLPGLRNTFKVVPASLGDDAACFGAAKWYEVRGE